MENRYELFTTLINSISRNIRRIKTKTMKDVNLKSHHVSCLYYLYKEKSLTATELTELADEDKAAISRSLEYLEKNEYIIKSKNKNRYNYKIKLTEKGNEIGKYIADKIDKILQKSSEGVSSENLAIFYETLKLIDSNLKKI